MSRQSAARDTGSSRFAKFFVVAFDFVLVLLIEGGQPCANEVLKKEVFFIACFGTLEEKAWKVRCLEKETAPELFDELGEV
jgi:hypothetical protein